MSAIDHVFAQLRQEGRKTLIPFISAGDPDLEFTAAMLRRLPEVGIRLCEVGIPYSDPIADGPVIQASYTRALQRGISVRAILEAISPVATQAPIVPITMVSYAIVYRHGLETYVREAKQAGVAGLIVPDLPLEESSPLADVCRREDLSLIQLITPTTPKERAKRIAEQTTGFIYYVSVVGITGERKQLPPELVDNVAWLRDQTDLPICIGFGISQPEHVRMLAPVADGLIVGSALVRRIAEAKELPRQKAIETALEFLRHLAAALEPNNKITMA
ncbi:MAG: tryptophan synthase subunit alpha [Thermoguttaceae bacterium]|nr:tryptophan synthase subunit alpha [Thermoguttaceae bacterium]MDW8037090.1 tryptophan synthase subunit alpha [Thermoguttaceae bacterium]